MRKGEIDPYFEVTDEKFDYDTQNILVIDGELIFHKIIERGWKNLFRRKVRRIINDRVRQVLQFAKIQYIVKSRFDKVFVVNLSPDSGDYDFLFNTLGYEFGYMDNITDETSYRNWLAIVNPRLHICTKDRLKYCRNKLCPETEPLHVD